MLPLAALVGAILLQVPPPDVPRAGNPFLDRAITQIENLEEREALKSLARAREQAGSEPGELGQIFLYQGMAYAGLAREPEAVDSFRRAVSLNPHQRLPPTASPKVRAWWKLAGGADAPTSLTPPKSNVAAAPALPPANVQERPVEPAPSFWRRHWVSLATLGLAAVAGGAGAFFGAQAKALSQSAQSEPDVGKAVSLQGSAQRSANAANTIFIIGGALGTTAVVTFAFDL